MALTKIIDPSGWDFDRQTAVMVKISSRGLIGNDRSDFIKIASHVFLPVIDQIKVAKDEVPVHMIALGASEYYGCNRNGDGFKEATCHDWHHTFEKYAKAFRNHRNKLANNDPYYGFVKKSAYNDDMHRVELLVLYNATKEAAERNGGFVADKELEKLAKSDLPVSMATRVPFDICSSCKNKARTREEYCTEKTCPGGGCKENLTKISEDGHILHVDNPDPQFFDISHVYRPADRIAYGARADWLDKAASHQFTPGAELADMLSVTAPLSVCLATNDAACWGEHTAGQIKLAHALACLERCLNISPETFYCFAPAVSHNLSDSQLGMLSTPGTEKAAAALAALADRKVILSLRNFASWHKKQASYETAKNLLPGIYRELVAQDSFGTQLEKSSYDLQHAAYPAAGVRVLANTLVKDLSLEKTAVTNRAMLGALRSSSKPELKTSFYKQASDSPQAAALARDYAFYQLAALYKIASFDDDFYLTASLAVGQNRVY